MPGITHDFTSPKSDGGDTTLLRPSDWNAEHLLDVAAPSGLTGATAPARFVGGTTSGAPITGTFEVGDFVIDQTGKVIICTVAGSPGTWGAVTGGADLVQVASGAGSVRIPGLKGSPDVVPASPSAYDDEFNSLTGWTTLGTLDTLNVTDFASHLHIKRACAAWEVSGIYKALPSVPFTVTAKIADGTVNTNYQSIGLILLEAGNAKMHMWGSTWASTLGNLIAFRSWWSNHTTRTSYASVATPRFVPYFRIIVTATNNVAFDYSYDGFIYNRLSSAVDLTFTPAYVGLAMSGQDTALTVEAAIDWIRFT